MEECKKYERWSGEGTFRHSIILRHLGKNIVFILSGVNGIFFPEENQIHDFCSLQKWIKIHVLEEYYWKEVVQGVSVRTTMRFEDGNENHSVSTRQGTGAVNKTPVRWSCSLLLVEGMGWMWQFEFSSVPGDSEL